MTKTTKVTVYSIVFLLYLSVMIALPLNFFTILIIVPFIASGWAAVVLVQFLKERKQFMADIEVDKAVQWDSDNTYLVKWEEEPKDIEWKFHTIVCVVWVLYNISMLVMGLAMRGSL